MARNLGAWLLILVTGQRWFFEQFLAGERGIFNFKRLLMIVICYWLQQLAECVIFETSGAHYFTPTLRPPRLPKVSSFLVVVPLLLQNFNSSPILVVV